MAALAHLPPAALDHSSSPTTPIATKLKDGVFKYHNNDRVEYGGLQTIFRHRIESTTAWAEYGDNDSIDDDDGIKFRFEWRLSPKYYSMPSSDSIFMLYLPRLKK
jgi:hypothetical protein